MESLHRAGLTARDPGGVHAVGGPAPARCALAGHGPAGKRAEGILQQLRQHPVPAPSATPPGELTYGEMLTLLGACPVKIPPESGTAAAMPLVVTPCQITQPTTGRNSHER